MHALKTYIVEDSVVIRENLIETLEELGPIEIVGTAVDEASAVQWLQSREGSYDLVIVDLVLRNGSGLGVLRAAQRLEAPHKLVVLSNYSGAAIRRQCLKLGADRVFDKSMEIDALLQYCGDLALARGHDRAFALDAPHVV